MSPSTLLLGFNGQPRDPLTGHYLLGNGYRAFNPVLMRFNSPDNASPFGKGGLNAYAYCLGDPVNMHDPTGHIAYLALLRMGRSRHSFAYMRRQTNPILDNLLSIPVNVQQPVAQHGAASILNAASTSANAMPPPQARPPVARPTANGLAISYKSKAITSRVPRSLENAQKKAHLIVQQLDQLATRRNALRNVIQESPQSATNLLPRLNAAAMELSELKQIATNFVHDFRLHFPNVRRTP